MLRAFVHLATVLALLLQLGSGWAQVHLSPHEPSSAAKSAASELAPPCHGEAKAGAETAKAATPACCAGDCNCEQACSPSALPAAALDLDDFISAHFEALRAQPDAAPAHDHRTPRPPAPQG